MKTSKNKINIGLGVATGLLVGFVLGVTFGPSDSVSLSGAHAEGNVSRLSRQRVNGAVQKESSDSTFNLSATDTDGNIWEITVNKK